MALQLFELQICRSEGEFCGEIGGAEDVEAGGEMGDSMVCAAVDHPALHVMDVDGCTRVSFC